MALDGSAQDASTGELEAIDVEARALGEVWEGVVRSHRVHRYSR